MKKHLFATLALALAFAVQAKPVHPTSLARIAANVLQRTDVVDVTPESFTHCRLYAGSDGTGFVLLSADDCVVPLLGYSLTETFDPNDIPPQVASWIDGYQRDIAAYVAMGLVPTREVSLRWQELLAGAPKARIEGSPVAPLLTAQWRQSPYYNDMCPYDSVAGARTVTGCAATAAAQVMHYWGHPARGRGQYSYIAGRLGEQHVVYDSSVYDWDNMPNSLNIGSAQVKKAAVAKLCYEAGVSMNMSYGTGASGAYVHSGGMLGRGSTELGLKRHFSYNPGMYTTFKQGRSDEEWDDIVSNELNASRPVIYTGSGTGAHAFVVDGYNEAGYYHVNWGWGGPSNGYFTISNLTIGNPGQQGYSAYNEMNEAVIGLYPIQVNEGTSEVALVSADPTMGTVSGSGTYSVDADRVFLRAHPAEGYRFSHWASGNTANPIFFYPTVDYRDTAYFVPIASGDTLSYCQRSVPNFDTVYSRSHCEWGIRIPASRIPQGKFLREVETFVYTAGDYTLRIYQGPRPETPIFEQTYSLQPHGWRSMDLVSPLREVEVPDTLDPTLDLWITLATDGVIYAQGITPYTGVEDGSWVKNGDTWQPVDTLTTGYYTWSIRGILQDALAIATAEDDGLACQISGRQLTVSNPDRRSVALYDAAGRRLAESSTSASLSFRIPAAGVYLLQADALPARRIVVK